ncbi:MAG: sugar transferase [Thermoanaerobaculia bacterium]|nr:sugar transferase [Thermoanaerobaculia bacterium]
MNGLPRWVDSVVAAAGLIAALPFLTVAGALVWITSPGPALFRQARVGHRGTTFTLLKLRSMRPGRPGEAGPEVTARGDARITPIGRLLRRTKLDELPQLWNVIRGDLALVGPRPEVPGCVALSDSRWRQVLAVRPGLTDPVTLRLRDEEALLAELRSISGVEAEEVYRRHLQPWKLQGYLRYLEQRTAWSDLRCLFATALSPLGLSFGMRLDPPTVEELLVPAETAEAGQQDTGRDSSDWHMGSS